MGANDFRSVRSFVEPLDWRGWLIPLALAEFFASFLRPPKRASRRRVLAFGVAAATVRDILDD